MSSNALLLLADHIKLSLLERQRAKSLNLTRDSQDGHISRSLDQFREGLEGLEKEEARLRETGDESKANSLASTLTTLRKQYHDLSTQFHGFPTPATSSTLTSPNDPSLAADFIHAQSSTSSPPPPNPNPNPNPTQRKPSTTPKTVRFTDTPDLEAQNNPLFPYRDDPSDDSAGYRAQAESLPSNVQIHAYHAQILAEQDAQLDALGESIGRQRELSMRIGDELDEQVLMLDESERVVDRHQNTLDRARRQVNKFAKSASESRQMVAIVVLIVILVLLIAILK
ncbi:hypothetical protein QBC47DRAFT_461471 [Echria macrotheca]|uniref:t-SNARE coiled-coil homology domain-containing protein n=1 Tax=Echria macrotheca TaxID=438768 RepID=A0AAJ0B9V3_9PEZI|nr:hypothetical protein QBC47DRAFT_461471 [Echria macrotheca]